MKDSFYELQILCVHFLEKYGLYQFIIVVLLLLRRYYIIVVYILFKFMFSVRMNIKYFYAERTSAGKVYTHANSVR